ncbi:MAG: SGNH/GDSL hydrolase family protein [Lachnospiraceae bacterium]|nr:SGNH/GDSL hydrolase family protein [Lachnospiraceae bacterium]
MADNKNNEKFKPEIILYWLFPVIGLFIPIIYYIFNNHPVLSPELTEIIAYTQYLAENNSHSYIDTWDTSITILPLSVKYFLTVYSAGVPSWRSALEYSVFTCYSLMGVSFLLFVYSLKAQKITAYIISACAIVAIGFVSVITAHTANSFMLAVTIIFLTAAPILLGVRSHVKLPAKTLISVLCILPTLLFLIACGVNSGQRSVSEMIKNEIKTTVTGISNLQKNTDMIDSESVAAGLVSYLSSHNYPAISSDAYTANILSVCSERQILIPTAPILNDLTSPTQENCPYISTENIIDSKSSFMYIIDNSRIADYNEYFILAEEKYSDEYYTVYSFSRSDYLSNSNIISDLHELNEYTYDTVLLSMYDISNYNMDYFPTYMGWNCKPTKNILTSTDVINTYNQFIFSGKRTINQYLFCIDPYIIYESLGFDSKTYSSEIYDSVIEMIDDNPTTTFYLYFPSYSINHFRNYTATDFSNLRTAYKILADELAQYDNVKLYYSGYEEYIYNNTYLYEDGSDCLMHYDTENAFLLENLADNTLIDADELVDYVDLLISNIQSPDNMTDSTYDLSEYCTVYCGDSILALISDNTGIPYIISNFSGMGCILRAIGGSNAATVDGNEMSLKYQLNPDIINSEIEAFGMSEKKLLFVIEFGLNDYFVGLPINNPRDKYDEYTYSGIIRSSIELIREEWPDSQILVIVPGYITMRQNGNERVSPKGGILDDYRKAAQKIIDEYGLYSINLCEIGITQENSDTYLNDQVHYNSLGRYYVARAIMEYICSEVK